MAHALDATLTQLSEQAGYGASDAARFAQALTQLPASRAARINARAFAEAANLPPQTALTLFVLGTKAGLFDLEWDMVCPMCGAIMQAVQQLDQVQEDSTMCAYCQLPVESLLDDSVEISFAYTPPQGLPDLHSDFDTYRHYLTAASHPFRDQFTAYHKKHTVADIKLAPGAEDTWPVTLDPDEAYRLFCMDTHSAVNVAAGPPPHSAPRIVHSRRGLEGGDLTLPAGPSTLRVANMSDQPIWLRLVRLRFEDIKPIISSGPAVFGPRVTGKDLLNNQVFRDTFTMDSLAPDLKLKLRSLTLLFTDLKGSTALYDREGDLAAYRLVQDHFVALKDVVRAHSGAMIKTMGDAVMAAFPSGADGVRAAVEMMAVMPRIAEAAHAQDVGLKVGLHSGPALAINAGNAVDYFGQTVNIAARVQGLADAGDICLTQAVAAEDDALDALAAAGFAGMRERARLKGVSQTETVVRYRMASEAAVV